MLYFSEKLRTFYNTEEKGFEAEADETAKTKNLIEAIRDFIVNCVGDPSGVRVTPLKEREDNTPVNTEFLVVNNTNDGTPIEVIYHIVESQH